MLWVHTLLYTLMCVWLSCQSQHDLQVTRLWSKAAFHVSLVDTWLSLSSCTSRLPTLHCTLKLHPSTIALDSQTRPLNLQCWSSLEAQYTAAGGWCRRCTNPRRPVGAIHQRRLHNNSTAEQRVVRPLPAAFTPSKPQPHRAKHRHASTVALRTVCCAQ